MLNRTIRTWRRSWRSLVQPRFVTPCLLAVVLFSAASCADDVTAIVVKVSSGLAKTEIDKVTFQVTGNGVADPGQGTRSVDLNAEDFPLTMAIVQAGSAAGPLTVTVQGWHGNETTPRCQETRTAVRFEKGKVITVSMSLAIPANGGVDAGADSGSNPGVDAGTGKDGGTDPGPMVVDAGADAARPDVSSAPDLAPARDGGPDLSPFDAPGPDVAAPDSRPDVTPGVDGAVDARADAAVDLSARDAAVDSTPPVDAPRDTTPPREAGTGGCGTAPGCACQADCPEGTMCRCAGGCGCTLTCEKNKNCNASCTGAGTQCTVNSAGVSTGTITCSGGASCVVDGSGKVSNLNVACEGGSCAVDCTQASNCFVACRAGAQCLVSCDRASNCGFLTCAAGVMMSCPGNVTVCNRPCP